MTSFDFMTLPKNEFPCNKFTFEIHNKEKLPFQDVLLGFTKDTHISS